MTYYHSFDYFSGVPSGHSNTKPSCLPANRGQKTEVKLSLKNREKNLYLTMHSAHLLCTPSSCFVVYKYFPAYIHLRFKHTVLAHTSAIWVVCLGQ